MTDDRITITESDTDAIECVPLICPACGAAVMSYVLTVDGQRSEERYYPHGCEMDHEAISDTD